MIEETFESKDTTPRAIPMHVTDYDWAFSNPERVITVRVRGHLSDDGRGIGGRLVQAVDENGNPYSIVGLDPGLVRTCPGCARRVYIPDTAVRRGIRLLDYPYTDCAARLSTWPAFGDEPVEDRPGEWRGAECREHGPGCPR